MLAPKCSTYNGRPTFANPRYLKKAQSEKPCLYEIPYDTSDLANRFAPNREETMTLANESRSKLNKDYVKPYDYTRQNSLYEIFKAHCSFYQLESTKERLGRQCGENRLLEQNQTLLKTLPFYPFRNPLVKDDFSNIYDLLLKECVSKDVTCSYLHSLSDLNAYAELQCLYLHKVKECECLAQKFSKQTEFVNKEVHNKLLKSFAKLENHSISLELALQQCKEQMKNNSVCKENGSNVFRKEREQYHEIQDLKAQMQDKNIAISELKKLIEKCKGKSVETQYLNDVNARTKKPKIVQLILFIVDSGCTKHMTGNLKLLCNFVEKFLGTVHFGNDQFAPILGYRRSESRKISRIKTVINMMLFDVIKTPVHPNSEHVLSPVPLNHAKPLEALANEEHVSTNTSADRMDVLRNQTDEHVTPRPVANVDKLVLGEEKSQENFDPTFVNEGHVDNEGGISGLLTQPSPVHHLDQRLESVKKPGVRDESAIKRSLKLLCQSAQQQANTLLYFKALIEEHANLVYAHKSCKDTKVRYKECKKELASLQSAFDEKVSAYGRLSKDYDAVLTREKGWQEKVEELEKIEKEKAEIEEVCAKQAERQLEAELKQSEIDTHQLRVDREKYVVECGNGEMVRRRIINEYLFTFMCRLHQSAEYKRSLGEAFSLAVGKGFIEGISIGRKDPDIQPTPNVDPASSDTFMETYEKLFDKRYPYVDKVARAYLLDPTRLQNVMPDETGPTPGEGPRDTPTTSYA
ncbi:hypothetical protein Tco_1019710 [Tanacetum coccineum]|uniref:Retrovirus-related Pol polyprotein from transposon TNT 1-94-like beta-barrel domain-containing protein n=1 Tax=Tanacetum coccineum TaxID=301880 RepID=A0ABQ5FY64_9ASTR